MKQNKKYYILYKTITNEDGKIIDCEDIANTNNDYGTFSNYKEIREFLHCINRDISKMINNNINNFDKIKTYKNYFVIKED